MVPSGLRSAPCSVGSSLKRRDREVEAVPGVPSHRRRERDLVADDELPFPARATVRVFRRDVKLVCPPLRHGPADDSARRVERRAFRQAFHGKAHRTLSRHGNPPQDGPSRTHPEDPRAVDARLLALRRREDAELRRFSSPLRAERAAADVRVELPRYAVIHADRPVFRPAHGDDVADESPAAPHLECIESHARVVVPTREGAILEDERGEEHEIGGRREGACTFHRARARAVHRTCAAAVVGDDTVKSTRRRRTLLRAGR